jgi:CheY-like chemotaxis protein
MKYTGLTVLIVDDNNGYRKYLRKLIETRIKANVKEASNPKDAFEYMNKEIPSLILLDMQMPIMDGYTALGIIRKKPETQNVPVIPCTALASTELVVRLSQLNISDYIIKSGDAGLIVEKIRHTLDKILEQNNPDSLTDAE